MSEAPGLTKDYLTALLKEDALAISKRVSANAFPSKKRAVDAPRANTRFLTNLIRNTDSHNSALLAREAHEAKVKASRHREASKRPDRAVYSVRGRHDGRDGQTDPVTNKRRRVEYETSRRSESLGDDDALSRHRRSRTEHSSTHTRSSQRSRKRSRSRSRSRSPKRTHDSNSQRLRPDSSRYSQTLHHRDSHAQSESEDDLGPQPASSRSRRQSSTRIREIDKHFRPDYDPSTDITLDPDDFVSDTRLKSLENDWDQALEALRDRQKLVKHGKDRLLAAGFRQDEVDRFTGSRAMSSLGSAGANDSSHGVVWKEKGQAREWDLGKI